MGQPSNKLEEEQHLIAFAQQDYDLIIGVGFAMQDEVSKIAKEYPEKKFAIIDGVIPDVPNVASLLFKEHEGSFMVGALGLMMSKTKKLGFVGGMDIPLIRKFETGYREGVHYIDASAEVLVKYTGSDPSAWNDPVKGREITLSLITQGCDVVFHAAGGTGGGVIRGCKEKEVFAIGVDSDQDSIAPGAVITSVIKRLDTAIINLAGEIAANVYGGAPVKYNIGNAGLTFSAFKHTKNKIGAKKYNRIFSAVFSK